VRSFKEIIEGKHDEIPERAFLLKGTIDEVVQSVRGEDEGSEDEEEEEQEEEQGADEEEGS
jgi:F-type H+/Na+-transporting ATPase subunit beta